MSIVRHAKRALLAALFLSCWCQTARAEPPASATTGLWPDVSVPPVELRTEPSKDAALVVGIERYDALPRIAGAAENARDWEKYFLFGRRIPPERVRLLTDQASTVEAIAARARELAASVPEGGTLFVIFIGHGAPSEGGKKGLLLGADVRPSDASFAARALSYDQLVGLTNTGKQARTVMVLDACFSGISNEGKTLLADVQPVVATSLITPSKTTLFSAGTAGEYAGALPGSQRPALSYLVLGGLRGWADTDGDGKVTSSELHAYASLVLRSLPNNHEQHPQIATDSEADVLESGKEKGPDLAAIRSKLDTWQPPVEEAPLPPKLRAAIVCFEGEPVSADAGLAVYLDNSAQVAVPSGAERVWDPALGRNVLRSVEFPITKGRHHVLVRVPGCVASETDVDVDPVHGAEVAGTLRSATAQLARGPEGTPNWGRLALSAWIPFSLSGYKNNLKTVSNSAGLGGLDYQLSAVGVMVQPALVVRFVSLGLDLGFASGRGDRGSSEALTSASAAATADSPDLTWFRLGVRAGFRIPLHYVAVQLGGGLGYDNLALSHLPAGIAWRETSHSYVSGWALIDGTPFCDWHLFGGAHLDKPNVMQGGDEAGTLFFGIQLGIAYQPNAQCERDRSAHFGLEARHAAKESAPR